jgi:hypothetical protein
MTVLHKFVSHGRHFTLTVRTAPPLPLILNDGPRQTFVATTPCEHCQAWPAFQLHGRMVWQTGGPSVFADVTASYYPLNSPTLTLAIANHFFPDDNNDDTGWPGTLARAVWAGATQAATVHQPTCGGTLWFSHGRYHAVDSRQLAYHRVAWVLAYTALADYRTLSEEQVFRALRMGQSR